MAVAVGRTAVGVGDGVMVAGMGVAVMGAPMPLTHPERVRTRINTGAIQLNR